MATLTFDRVNRIIEVAAPDVSVTVQDLYNQIRGWEDEPRNMDLPKLCDAAGKFDLGGGEATAVSLKLIDWRVRFEARGSFTMCQVTGGNLIAVDEHEASTDPVADSANTFVVIRQSTAPAAIQTGGDLLTGADIVALAQGVWARQLASYTTLGTAGSAQMRQAFEGGVWVNVDYGSTGTAYPKGTKDDPVTNLTDAKAIADAMGFRTFYVMASYYEFVLDQDMEYYHFEGVGGSHRAIYVVSDGVSIDFSSFKGIATYWYNSFHQGGGYYEDCWLYEMVGKAGDLTRCQISWSWTLDAGVDNYGFNFKGCSLDALVIDVNGATNFFIDGDVIGALTLQNITRAETAIVLSFSKGGQITFESSCTAGTATIYGDCTVVDNSSGMTVNDRTGTAKIVDVQSRIPASLSSGRMRADTEALAASVLAATNLATAKDTMIIGTVDDAAFAPTLTQFETSLTDALANVYKGRSIVFLTTELLRNPAVVLTYSLVGGRGRFTVSEAMPAIPVDGTAFIIV
ncbi:MAG: hypothetical protein GY769_07680 [bacterium]|nr:hypothetical protein [bacterium]